MVLITGYDTDTILPERYRGIGVLRKPIDRDRLLERLRPLLALPASRPRRLTPLSGGGRFRRASFERIPRGNRGDRRQCAGPLRSSFTNRRAHPAFWYAETPETHKKTSPSKVRYIREGQLRQYSTDSVMPLKWYQLLRYRNIWEPVAQ